MELLDQYLEAVGRHLRGKRRDDIVAELRANLEAQLDDREAELGRPLTQPEVEQWLKQLGAPMMMAARYQPHEYLIGPGLYPIYRLVLGRVIGWAAAIYAIVSVVTIATGTPNAGAALNALVRLPGVLLWVAAWVTLIFAVVEYFAGPNPEKWSALAEYTTNWSPAKLAPLEKAARRAQRQRSFVQALAESIFGFLFLVWLLLIPHYPWLLMGPGALLWKASPFQLAPVWTTFYWWVVVAHAFQLVWLSIDLVRKTWQKGALVRRTCVRALELIPVSVLFTAPGQVLITLRNPAADAESHGATLAAWNHDLHTALMVAVLLMGMQLAWWILQMIQNRLRNGAR